MPMVREMLTRITGRAPLLHDPDECVAKGAALQAALILQEGNIAPVQVNHVLPHSLGVATIREEGTTIEHIVPSLTALPCANAREEFTTTVDNQTSVQVHIYEGEANDPSAYPNGPIGIFHLDTTPPRPKGQPKIRVEFRCDENGRIMAVARDQDTGKESRAYVTLGSGRSDAEMQAEQTWLSEAVIA
jgi:molecular chaperone DnaK